MSTLTIKPGAATDDAAQIKSIVESITDSMDKLNTAINKNIPAGVDTSWSNEVKEHWNKYYSSDIPSAMEEMKASASNLELAVREAIKYSQEQ